MSVNNHQEADDRIADALWFFKGMAVNASEESGPTISSLGRAMLDVRRWLGRFTNGSQRLLGTNDREFAIVLTEREFDLIRDGLLSSERSDERQKAKAAIEHIFKQYAEEAQRFAQSQDPEAPF